MEQYRFGNLLKLTNLSKDRMWKVVKGVKLETNLDAACTAQDSNAQMSQVKAVEQKLQIKSSEQKFDNLTDENLKMAAEMCIYLITCPGLYQGRCQQK